MTKLPIGTETRLAPGALFKLEDGVHAWLECVEGAIWVSQTAQPRDVVIAAGESIALAAPHNAIIGAINGPAVVWTGEGRDLSLAA